MTSTRPAYLIILSLVLLFSITSTAVAEDDDDNYEDDYDIKARVVRISLLNGEVRLKRNGDEEWESARLNYPLVEGDMLKTDPESHAEIQIDSRNFLRLGGYSSLEIVTLRDDGIALSLSEGTASLRLARFDREREYLEIDAPGSTIAAEQTGLYRIDVETGQLTITVRDGGRARIYSASSGFVLRDGRLARLNFEAPDADWELMATDARDSWDDWVDNREQQLAQRLRYESPYYDNKIWGAEDLDSYGNWTYANDYGWIWRPHVTVINNYNNWAPYRHGHWTWCPPYGWTWVGHEPWGWAPYHYGRWVYHNNYWAWSPRSHYHRQRSWWRPALVAFVSINHSFGPQIYWYPLSYRQRDPQSRHYRGAGRGQLHPAHLRAVTGLRPEEFGRGTARLWPADETVARGIFSQDPLRGLGFRPAERRRAPGDGINNDSNRGSRGRRTGAIVRTPGIPLNDELSRSRIWNRRAPRTFVPGYTASPPTRTTGVISRPTDRRSRGNGNNSGRQGAGDNTERLPGKVRMIESPDSRSNDQKPPPPAGRPRGGPDKQAAEDKVPPITPPSDVNNRGQGFGAPSRPAVRPGRTPDRTDTRQPFERPVQREKIQPSTPSTESPEGNKRSAPRSEPAPRNDKPVERPVSPRRADPPPQRSEPRPQRSEPPAKPSGPQRERQPAESDKANKANRDRPARVERKNDPQ